MRVRQRGLYPCVCASNVPPAPGGARRNAHPTGHAGVRSVPLIFHTLPTVTLYALALCGTLWYALIGYLMLPPCFLKTEETTLGQHVTYQLTREETDIYLAQDHPALDALRLAVAQALREAGDPSHVDVLLTDGTVGWTMDSR